jgi:uncharacterized repeat protein (TIGR03803 family)
MIKNGGYYGRASYYDYGSGLLHVNTENGNLETVYTNSYIYSRIGSFSSAISVDGSTFYGVNSYGGEGNAGYVYSASVAGVLTNLYSFGADRTDGNNPNGFLILSTNDTTLYGTTENGGTATNYRYRKGGGTLFAIDIGTGDETILHDFGSITNDGVHPNDLTAISADGQTLYGTTSDGGPDFGSGIGIINFANGVVYSINSISGAYTILYNFGSNTNDGTPTGGLTISPDGKNLYGVSDRNSIFQINLTPPILIVPTINFSPSQSQIYSSGRTFRLNATANSGGAITYKSSNTNVISVLSNTATINAIGTTTITAMVQGIGNYSSAAAASMVVVSESPTNSPSPYTNSYTYITFIQPPSMVTYSKGGTFRLNTSASAGGTITFTSSNQLIKHKKLMQ